MEKPKVNGFVNNTTHSLLDIKIIKEVSDIPSILNDWRRLLESEPYKVPDIDPEHYLFEIESLGPEAKPYIICLSRNHKIISMLIARKEKIRFPIRLGYFTFFKTPVRRVLVFHGGFIGQKDKTNFLLMYYTIRKALSSGEAEIAAFNHPHLESLIYKLTKKYSPLFTVIFSPRKEGQWIMDVPVSIESFYINKPRKQRYNLQREIKKLEKNYLTSVKKYYLDSHILEGIKHAAVVSKQSFQYSLEVGFVDNERTRLFCKLASQKGWIRIYLLYINNEPAAYLWGLIYGNTFFLRTIGFDSRWKKESAGKVLFQKALKDLIETENIKLIDFGFGDTEYKRHFATKKLDTQSFYLYGKKPYPLFLYLINFITSNIWKFSIIILRALGSEDKFKKIWKERLSA